MSEQSINEKRQKLAKILQDMRTTDPYERARLALQVKDLSSEIDMEIIRGYATRKPQPLGGEIEMENS